MSLKGTKTAENLMKSFINECQARTRYDYYASQAKKDGYVQIQNIFAETAKNEKEHAKRFYKFLRDELEGEEMEITNTYPINFTDTLSNLKAAAAGEHEEQSCLYPKFADIAAEEGFIEIANVFSRIAEVEERHEIRFKKLIENIEQGKVFKRDEVKEWKCNNCGYIHIGTEAPDVCPACDHPIDHFEIFKETY